MNGTENGIPARKVTAGGWRKSRHSGASGNRVELATLRSQAPDGADRPRCRDLGPGHLGTEVAVRNSRRPDGYALRFPRATMELFLAGIKHGAFASPPAPRPRQSTEVPRPPKMINGVLGEMTDRLAELTERGFQFAETHDARGKVVALSGVRSHSGVIDIVQLFGEHDADAVRIPGSEPNIFFPRNILWRVTGRPETVLTGILGLADPVVTGNCPAPRVRRGPWVSDLSYRGT
ncbi:MAG TPA: DUF397 domain-containing protein [Pseudonocardiaceae bacterium]|jgi:hypothetical protein|nr:DUF397 domain-containing protein [Pseudonocardiaceae bacterium]